MVRGLDYYTGTVFEVTHPALGGQDALAAGGRYDNLVKDMGGPDARATGFAIGMERVIIALGDKKDSFAGPTVVYIATLGKDAKINGLKLAEELKKELNKDRLKIITLIDFAESSLKSQMRNADKNMAKIVIIIGDDEIAKGEATLRDMASKEQTSVKFSDIVKVVSEKLIA